MIDEKLWDKRRKIEDKIEEREKSHRKKCEEQEQKIKDCCDAGFMGYENSMDSCFHRLIEEHPFLEPLFLREMYWSRIRELEEIKKILEQGEEKNTEEPKEEEFVVRLYDGFDNEWIDVSKPVSKEEAQRIWNEKTKNGTQKTNYEDMDYYDIFPADTIMLRSSREGRTEE